VHFKIIILKCLLHSAEEQHDVGLYTE